MSMPEPIVRVQHQTRAALGEGALWDGRRERLLWVDILGQKVMLFDPETGGNQVFTVGRSVGTVVMTEGELLLLGLRDGIGTLSLESGDVRVLVDPEPNLSHTRLNDGKCDPEGRFWVGSICEKPPHRTGGLYCLERDLSLSQKLTEIQCSNGLVWSGDGRRFYYIDTPTQEIALFDYQRSTGTITNRRVLTRIDPKLGAPDGMTIDTEDRLYVALFAGQRVVRINPRNGEIDLEIPIPAVHVTSLAFGGKELDRMFVTTARVGLGPSELEQYPNSGCLFVVEGLEARGVPATRFSGRLG